MNHIKHAKLITLDGKPWLVNGTWSAGGRYPKKPKFKSVTKEELFDPRHTAAVWLRESEQVGWFVFPDNPQKGRALAPLVLPRISLNDAPWKGVFKVDGGWWVVAVDDAMALHPLWDVWVADADFDVFYAENSAKWMTFSHSIQTNSIEETVEWLMEDGTGNAPKVAPVIARTAFIKGATLAMSGVLVLTVAGLVGYHYWEKHENAVEKIKIMQQEMRERLMAEAGLKKEELAKERLHADILRIEHKWKTWPKPWTHTLKWQTLIHTCEQMSSGSIIENGWTMTQVACHWGKRDKHQITINRTWVRGDFATVNSLPNGNIMVGKMGNIAVQTRTQAVTSTMFTTPSHNAVIPSSVASMSWLGTTQKWHGVIKIQQGAKSAFIAPIPNKTPPQVVKALHPPVLWHSFPVTLSSIYKPNKWPLWSVYGFVPSEITIYLGSDSHYNLQGVQYAQ